MPALKNPRHEKFARALAKGLPQAEAYRDAFGKDNRAQASRLSGRDEIQSRVADIVQRERIIEQRAEEKAVQRAVERAAITKERILEEYAKIAFAEVTDVMEWGDAVVRKDEGGDLIFVQGVAIKNSADLPAHVRGAIQEVRKTKDGISIKMHPKLPALDVLGKTQGIGSDKSQAPANVAGSGDQLSDLEIARRLAFLLAKGAAQAKGD